MSLCSVIKEELADYKNPARHCDIAELSAILETCGRIRGDTMTVKSDNILIIKRADLLLKNAYNTKAEISVIKKKPAAGRQYKLTLPRGAGRTDIKTGSGGLYTAPCCKKAYIRGVFLSSALISDPEKTYHAEFILQNRAVADRLSAMLETFGKGANMRVKNGVYYSVYIKDSDAISDLLKIIGANAAVVELESIRVMRDFNNETNRRANCDSANFDKTASASAKMVLDIELIEKTRGLRMLPEPLREIAMLRLKNTEATLAEIGAMLRPPLSKSAVNHRFRKISRIADEIRK